MNAQTHKKICQILIERGLLKPGDAESCLREQSRTNEYIGGILVKRGLIKERDLLSALSEQFGIDFVELKNKYIDWSLAKTFRASLVIDQKCLPFEKEGDRISVAITNPLDAWVKKNVEEQAVGLLVKFVLVTEEDMREAVGRYKKYIGSEIIKSI